MKKNLERIGLFVRVHPVFSASILFFVSRWLLVFFNDGYAMTQSEELIYPTLAVERMRGNPLVSQMYYQEYTSGGYWLQSYLFIPLIMLIGCTQYAIKWLPILFSCGAFVAYFVFTLRYYGQKAAWLFACLAILGNPLFLQHQVIGFANHNELGIFLGPCLLMLFILTFDKKRSSLLTALLTFTLGLWSALGVFYCYSAMVFVLFLAMVCPLVFFRQVWKLGIRALLLIPAGYIGFRVGWSAIGLLRDHIGFNSFGIYCGFPSAGDIFIRNISESPSHLTVTKFMEFLFKILPRSFTFSVTDAGYLYFAIHLCCFIIAFVFLVSPLIHALSKPRRWYSFCRSLFTPNSLGIAMLLLVLFLYVAAFCAQSWYTNRELVFPSYHQMVVFHPFIFLTTAVILARLLMLKKTWQMVGWIFAGALFVLGCLSFSEITSYPPGYPLAEDKGSFSYPRITKSNIEAIQISFGPDKQCEMISQHARYLDPRHAWEICNTIEMNTDCDCPLVGMTKDQTPSDSRSSGALSSTEGCYTSPEHPKEKRRSELP